MEFFPTIHVTPLVEIFAVTVCDKNDVSSKEKCQIYGKIRVSDKLDNRSFDMYDRGQDNPQTISLGQTLLLTPPLDADNAVIIPSEYVSVNVQLWDRGGTVIANGSFNLDRTTSEEWSEDYLEKSVSGSENNLFAKVHYAIFPYAVTATVSVLYFHVGDTFDCFKEDVRDSREELRDRQDCIKYEENDDCLVFANLFGTVSASGVINGNHGKTAHLSSLLFDKPVEESVRVKSRGFIELSRSVVAVPAYSSLHIKADFFDDKTRLSVASGALEFKPNDHLTCKKDILGVNARIRVRVTWNVADKQLYSENSVKRIIPVTPDVSDCNEDRLKRTKLSSEHHSPAAVIDGCIFRPHVTLEASSTNCILSPNGTPPCAPAFEVSSVVVCSKNCKPFKFHGSVHVDDGAMCCLYHRDESSPQDCPNFGTLARIQGPSASFSALDNFGLIMNIKDNTGGIISSGLLGHYMMHMQVKTNIRKCSVIRGETGFTAIHYSYFPQGVTAVVDVKLHGKNLPAVVKGEISARHNSCESYSRQYQEKLFQSILFYDVPEGVLVDATGSTLPLVRSLVTVPRESHLVIETNLSVSPVGLGGVESLKGKVGFTGNEDSPMRIGKDDLYMEVFVRFCPAW